MDRQITIYALCDPDSGRTRYIGQTNQPDKRLRLHIFECVNMTGPKAQWINDLVAQGKQPLFTAIRVVNAEMADQVEVDEIKKAKAANVDLLNRRMAANGGIAKQRRHHGN